MHARLVRAKRKIAAAGIPYRVPPDELLPERVRGVLAVVYVIFTEGHTASEGDALTRPDLCAEAIRLGRLLARLMPDDAEVLGLLALMLLTDARRPARTGRGRRGDRPRPPGPHALGRGAIAEGLEPARPRAAPAPSRSLPAAGGDRRAARARAEPRGDRLARRSPSSTPTLHRREPTPVIAVNLAVAVGFRRRAAAPAWPCSTALRRRAVPAPLRAAARRARRAAAPRRRARGGRRAPTPRRSRAAPTPRSARSCGRGGRTRRASPEPRSGRGGDAPPSPGARRRARGAPRRRGRRRAWRVEPGRLRGDQRGGDAVHVAHDPEAEQRARLVGQAPVADAQDDAQVRADRRARPSRSRRSRGRRRSPRRARRRGRATGAAAATGRRRGR